MKHTLLKYSARSAAIVLYSFVLMAVIGTCQTTVYLRDNTAGSQIVSPGCSVGPPMVCSVVDASRFTIGDTVAIGGVASVNPGAYNVSNANGLRKISAVNPGANTVTVTDTSNGAITGNGVWQSGVGFGWGPGLQFIGKVSPYTLATGIKGYYDGDCGTLTRQWALTTTCGLTSAVVSGNVMTVTTSYVHGVQAGDHISVYNSSSSSLNKDGINFDYTVTGATAFTFTFTTSGVANADYAHSNDHCGPGVTPNGTIQGTDPCFVLSQRAVIGNLDWAKQATQANALPMPYPKFYVDGGGGSGANLLGLWELNANAFLVDRANHTQGTSGNNYLDVILYAINNVEKMSGATWLINEAVADAGSFGLVGIGAESNPEPMAVIFGMGQAYLTPAQRTDFVNKVLNDVADPVPCTKDLAVPHDTLATGIAAGVSSTSITLALSDTAANGFYVHNIVSVIQGGSETDLLVSGYTASTKVAVGTWSSFTPSVGATYSIYSTITVSTSAGGAAGVTITGYNTNFSADVATGDMIYGINPPFWNGGTSPDQIGTWVTGASVVAATSITNGVNSAGPAASTSTPQVYWRAPKWTAGHCGWLCLQKYFSGAAAGQPVSYPFRGGGATMNLTLPNMTSNNGLMSNAAVMTMLLALAPYDARAVTDLAIFQTQISDYNMSYQWNYITGYDSSGVNYGVGVTTKAAYSYAWNISHNVVGYPDVGLNGPWTKNYSIWKMFSALPDNPWTGTAHTHQSMFYGGGYSNNNGSTPAFTDMLLDHGMASNPTSSSSQFLKNYFQSLGYTTVGSLYGVNVSQIAVKIDPRIASVDYTTQPLQYIFWKSANPACSALTWWSPCDSAVSGNALLSRTSWTDPAATLVQFQARSYAGDHDGPQPGTTVIWKVGPLLASDNDKIGDSGGGSSDIIDSTPQFGTGSTLCDLGLGSTDCGSGKTIGTSVASITRWAGGNAGTLGSAYGDQNSRYVYAMADLTRAYTTAYNHVYRHFAHFKKPGSDETIILYDDIDAANGPTQIAIHPTYPQNQETVAGDTNLLYDEGDTTCPGPGGCGNLNANRTILEQQNGASDAHGDPQAKYNLISNFVIPAGAPAVFFHWDGTSYTGSNGHAYRVAICADAGSSGNCGAGGQNAMELIQVHSITTQPNTTLTKVDINPDSNWGGVQVNNSVVALFARHGATYGSMAGFTTTHTGTAQYLFAGLTPGTYTITINGTAVTGSPFTVSANDNTIPFESTAGVVSINGSVSVGPTTTAAAMTSAGSLSSGGRR